MNDEDELEAELGVRAVDLCVICHATTVDAEAGFDTCGRCAGEA